MLKPINMIRNAVRATRSLGPSSKARRTTCSVKPLGAILLALLMTLSTQVDAQVRKEFVCNKWSQMGDVETITTRMLKAAKPFVLVSDGNTLLFKNKFNNKIVASRLGYHTIHIDLYSRVDNYGTTHVFYYFHKDWNYDVEPYELIHDPDMVELRMVGHSIGDLLGTKCFKR